MTGPGPVRVLVVDDSAFMRRAIVDMFAGDASIEVVGTAGDGISALERIAALRPDVVILDLDMPRLDGIGVLEDVMRRDPLPVIVVSGADGRDAGVALKALSVGAVDFISKGQLSAPVKVLAIRDEVVARVKAVATGRVRRSFERLQAPLPLPPVPVRTAGGALAVVIGSSTGGPMAVERVAASLPAGLPVPVLVVQHMPASFIPPFVERIGKVSSLRVLEAKNGHVPAPGEIVVAPGGVHMAVVPERERSYLRIQSDGRGARYCPSVDLAMSTAAAAWSGRVVGVILTGMGDDGTAGMRAIRNAGGYNIAQDEATSVVYGMPRCAFEAGVVDRVVPLDEVAGAVIRAL